MSKPSQVSDRFLRIDEVLERLPFGKSHLYTEMAARRAPRPIKLGRLSVWRVSDIEAYVERLIAPCVDDVGGVMATNRDPVKSP